MNKDQIKGALQRVGGRVEESAGALVGDQSLKEAGQEDQIKGDARQAWGNLQEAGDALVDRARAAKLDAEIKADRAREFDREHEVEITGIDEIQEPQSETPEPEQKEPRQPRKNPKQDEIVKVKSEEQSLTQAKSA